MLRSSLNPLFIVPGTRYLVNNPGPVRTPTVITAKKHSSFLMFSKRLCGERADERRSAIFPFK